MRRKVIALACAVLGLGSAMVRAGEITLTAEEKAAGWKLLIDGRR